MLFRPAVPLSIRAQGIDKIVDDRRVAGRLRILDAVVIFTALYACWLTLQVKGNYAFAPWIGVIPFCLLIFLFSRYRAKCVDRIKALWVDIFQYSLGSGSISWLAAFWFVVVPTFLINLSNNDLDWSGDTRPVVPTALSWITQGNANLDEFDLPGTPGNLFGVGSELPYYLTKREGGFYSAYPAGMTVLVAPFVGLAKLSGADLNRPDSQARLAKLAASWIEAVAIGLFFLVALRLARPRVAIVTTVILAFGSGMFSTVAQGIWQHGGIVTAVLMILLAEVATREKPGIRSSIVQGIALGMLPTFRLTSISFILPFAAWLLIRSPRRALLVGLVADFTYLPWAVWYVHVYGSPFGPSNSQMSGSNWTMEIGRPLVGLLVSPARGLLVYQPWVLLSLPAILGIFRVVKVSKGHRRNMDFSWVLFASVILHISVISAWKVWHGGYCWGSRLLVETLPLLALLSLPSVAVLVRSRPGRTVLASLFMISLLMQVPGVYLHASRWNSVISIDQHTEKLWSWSDSPYLYPWRDVGVVAQAKR